MSVDLQAIHRALAAQISAGLGRDTNVYPFPVSDPVFPCISIYPGSDSYVSYFVGFGPDGAADLNLRLKLDVDGDFESIAIKICDYLSVGTGNRSSIVDAIHSGRTLGGLVEDCVALSAQWADPDSTPGVAWIPVQIYLLKDGAA